MSKYTLECIQWNYFCKIFSDNDSEMYYNTSPLTKKLQPYVWK